MWDKTQPVVEISLFWFAQLTQLANTNLGKTPITFSSFWHVSQVQSSYRWTTWLTMWNMCRIGLSIWQHDRIMKIDWICERSAGQSSDYFLIYKRIWHKSVLVWRIKWDLKGNAFVWWPKTTEFVVNSPLARPDTYYIICLKRDHYI